MQVRVIDASVPEVFEHFLYGPTSPQVMTYIQNQFTTIGDSLTDAGRKFMEEARALHERLYDSRIERAAKAALRMADHLFNPNTIHPMESLDQIQSAAPLMQRYIMAEPYLRDKYLNQLCDGYSDTYVDMDPGNVGFEHYDYRRVVNGMMRMGDEEPVPGGATCHPDDWVCTNIFEELRENDRDLTFDEKVDILTTWDLARLFAQAGMDPTNPYGGEIG